MIRSIAIIAALSLVVACSDSGSDLFAEGLPESQVSVTNNASVKTIKLIDTDDSSERTNSEERDANKIEISKKIEAQQAELQAARELQQTVQKELRTLRKQIGDSEAELQNKQQAADVLRKTLLDQSE